MKMYKLRIRGSLSDFKISYLYSLNYLDFNELDYEGSEQQKYSCFVKEIKHNIAPQPVYVDIRMSDCHLDRVISRKQISEINEVTSFINILPIFTWHKG